MFDPMDRQDTMAKEAIISGLCVARLPDLGGKGHLEEAERSADLKRLAQGCVSHFSVAVIKHQH